MSDTAVMAERDHERELEALRRAREGLAPFLAAALRAASAAELAAARPDDALSLEVPFGDVRRALAVYEKTLGGGEDVPRWSTAGREHRRSDASAAEALEEDTGHFVLTVRDEDDHAVSHRCSSREAVREQIESSAAGSVGSLGGFLGAQVNGGSEALAGQLGRQAFRFLMTAVERQPDAPAEFALPDRPWLTLRRERPDAAGVGA